MVEYVLLYIIIVGVPLVVLSVFLWLLYATLMILPDQTKTRPKKVNAKIQSKKKRG